MIPTRVLPASKRLLNQIGYSKNSIIRTAEGKVWEKSQMNKMLESEIK